jgi:hypothetical protein
MPVISRFFGIVIFMNWRDHSPPHFHAKYGEMEISVDIETGHTTGYISDRALHLIQEWRELNKSALRENWKRSVEKITLLSISPLE